MKPLAPLLEKAANWGQRLDALSLRERGLIFAAGATLLFVACQTLLLAPLAQRDHAAEQRLSTARRRISDLEQLGSAIAADPLVAAAARNRSLENRRDELDRDLHLAAHDYLAPERMTELLREILTRQQGLALVSLSNLPVVSLSQAPAPDLKSAPAAAAARDDIGPFVHPVELVIDGDFANLLAYLRALEALPWRLHWQQLELNAVEYPENRVHIVIGALSLSQDWISL